MSFISKIHFNTVYEKLITRYYTNRILNLFICMFVNKMVLPLFLSLQEIPFDGQTYFCRKNNAVRQAV